jgi:hypothetical protein
MKNGSSIVQNDGKSSQSFIQKEPFKHMLPLQQQQQAGYSDYDSNPLLYQSSQLFQLKQKQTRPVATGVATEKKDGSSSLGSSSSQIIQEDHPDIEITGYTTIGTNGQKISHVINTSVPKDEPTSNSPSTNKAPSIDPLSATSNNTIISYNTPSVSPAAEVVRKRAVSPPVFVINPHVDKMFTTMLRYTREMEDIMYKYNLEVSTSTETEAVDTATGTAVVTANMKCRLWSCLEEFEGGIFGEVKRPAKRQRTKY